MIFEFYVRRTRTSVHTASSRSWCTCQHEADDHCSPSDGKPETITHPEDNDHHNTHKTTQDYDHASRYDQGKKDYANNYSCQIFIDYHDDNLDHTDNTKDDNNVDDACDHNDVDDACDHNDVNDTCNHNDGKDNHQSTSSDSRCPTANQKSVSGKFCPQNCPFLTEKENRDTPRSPIVGHCP
jgi:hypothetical protein